MALTRDRRYSRWTAPVIMLVLFLFALNLGSGAQAQGNTHVDVLAVRGAIDPWMDSYVKRGVGLAERDGAEAVIILLDTPGGALGAMENITTRLLNARVPVIVFVYPSGAWAGSAGTFITLAANVAAMAPGTTIGAAHPVDAAGQDIPTDERDKITNFSMSYIQGIANRRGRNAEWAAQAVSKSVAATAEEAFEARVIDLVAVDLNDLLNQLDGRTVQTAAGDVTLHTQHVGVNYINTNLSEQFFHVLIDPNVATILLSLGLLAIAFEIYNPGAIVPGVVGGICLILAFVSLGNLPVNWGGVVLIFLAVVLFVLDLKVSGFALTIGGVAMFVLGALMLFAPFTPPPITMPSVSVSPVVIVVVSGTMAAFFLFVLGAAVRGYKYPVPSGQEALVGATGRAVSDLTPGGQVHVRGEVWTAIGEGEPVARGDAVRVVSVSGLVLHVIKVDVGGVGGPGR